MTDEVDIRCDAAPQGFACRVTVGRDAAATTHDVRVDAQTLERLAPTATDPTALVRSSFAYLLAREPRESILRSFELSLIGRYFPDYEDDIRRP